ncbi:MAG: sigma factor [Planctomycetota bacterium]
MDTPSDLSRFAADGDQDAFARLVRRHERIVCAVCRRVLSNPADVDDAAQETFAKLAQHAGTVRGDVTGWLVVPARNAAVSRIRRDAARRRHEQSPAAVPHPAPRRRTARGTRRGAARTRRDGPWANRPVWLRAADLVRTRDAARHLATRAEVSA